MTEYTKYNHCKKCIPQKQSSFWGVHRIYSIVNYYKSRNWNKDWYNHFRTSSIQL